MGMSDYDSTLWGYDDLVKMDNADWYEITENSDGDSRLADSLSYKINNSSVLVYVCEIGKAYGLSCTRIVVKAKETNRHIYDILLKQVKIQGYIDTKDDVLVFDKIDALKDIKRILGKFVDLPKYRYRFDNGNLYIQFESIPPNKIKKRMRDFGIKYNLNTNTWVGYRLSKNIIDKVFIYLNKQYNN